MAKPPTGFKKCFADASAAAGKTLDADDLDFYFTQAQARINHYVREGLTQDAAAIRAGQELAGEARLARALEKRQARVNHFAKQGLLAREVPGRLYDSAEALIAGVHTRGTFRNAALSLDAMGTAQVRERMNRMLNELDDAGLVGAFKASDPVFERRVANEMGRIDDPTWGKDSGDAKAKQMAAILHRHQDALRLAQNDAGAWIGKLDQYIARQSHDGERIQRAGFEAWRDFIAPRLAERTFADVLPQDREAHLLRVWQALATGIHDGAPQADWIAGFKGPANLAKKISQERKLFFKDADAWFDYNKEFGNRSLNGTVMATMERGSRNLEAMRLLGTNPMAMLDSWIDDLAVRSRDASDIKSAEKLSRKKDYLLRLAENAMRAPQRIENATGAQIMSTVRQVQRFKLGGALISSIPDLAATTAMARHNGIGALDSLAWSVGELVPRGAERKAALRELDVGFDSMVQSLQTRFGAEDGVPGAMAKSVDLFTRLSGQPLWSQSMKNASTLMLTNNIAARLAKPFDAQPRLLKTTLQRYGIGPAEWAVLQKAEAAAPGDGRRYLTADGVMKLFDADLAPLGGNAAYAREALARKYRTYITDQVQEGMTEETPQVRDLLQGGSRARGTVGGEAWRTVMQFKQFPMTFMMRTLARELFRDGLDTSGLARMIAGATALGYLSMTIKDMLRGKEPFNPFDPGDYDPGQYASNVFRAAVQGGGFGLYGDFLLGEANRYGGGPLVSALGPAFGMSKDLADALYYKPKERMLDGTFTAGGFAADALGAVKGNVPFIGLFYARTALDYGVLYSLQETMNPGYLARMERRNEEQTGQEYMHIMRPSTNHFEMFGR